MTTVYAPQYADAFQLPFTSVRSDAPQTLCFDIYQNGTNGLPMLLRTLKTLSEQNKWIIFVGKDALINRNVLMAAGINLNKVRMLKQCYDVETTVEAIIDSGNYSAIVSAKPLPNDNEEDVMMITLRTQRVSQH
uniref:SulA-like leucine-rich domain-containing protein n=1 Tax=Thaumasiovibrio occultus TaxID=1891184 RepID=UPI000B361EE9|nr:SulA-like leucine-rich domain-containing protein [Thaumasiovibrio occultus]